MVDVNSTVSYSESAHAAGAGLTDDVCKDGWSWKPFPVGLLEYNITTIRIVYNLHKDLFTKHPDFNRSIVHFENFPMQRIVVTTSACKSSLVASFTNCACSSLGIGFI